jgi:hypothetical protein
MPGFLLHTDEPWEGEENQAGEEEMGREAGTQGPAGMHVVGEVTERKKSSSRLRKQGVCHDPSEIQ